LKIIDVLLSELSMPRVEGEDYFSSVLPILWFIFEPV